MADYEYRGLMAQAWDLLRGDTSRWADRSFYLDLIRAFGQPVLDVGCGIGRLLLDYLAQGIDVDGMDNSPESSTQAQARALFERAGFTTAICLYSESTHEPARPHDTLFVIVGC